MIWEKDVEQSQCIYTHSKLPQSTKPVRTLQVSSADPQLVNATFDEALGEISVPKRTTAVTNCLVVCHLRRVCIFSSMHCVCFQLCRLPLHDIYGNRAWETTIVQLMIEELGIVQPNVC